jgi:hypothetical protein
LKIHQETQWQGHLRRKKREGDINRKRTVVWIIKLWPESPTPSNKL